VRAIARFETLLGLKLNVGKKDLRIAAIALEAGCAVVTRNERDFRRVPGLAVENWAA
jgi:tRNA(fMet)-specific endonuclease VapC